jgi:type IV pilus assembly protein PilF
VSAVRSGLVGVALGLALCGCQTSGDTQSSATAAATAAQANMQLGSAYLQQGNLPVAKEKLERAVKQAPRDPAIHGLLAMLYLRLGEESRAETEYRAALALAPRDPDQLNNYAVFLCGAGRIDEGVARFQEAARNPLYRTPWVAYANAGVCLHSARRDAEAEPLYVRALQVQPDYAEAATQLVELLLAQNRAADAYGRVADFLKRNPATAELLLLGWRAARAEPNPVNTAQMAWRLQTEFPDSEQAHNVAVASAPRN